MPAPLPAHRAHGRTARRGVDQALRSAFLRALAARSRDRGDQPADRRGDRLVVGAVLLVAAPVFSAAYAYACQLEAASRRPVARGSSRSLQARSSSSRQRCSSRGSRSPPVSGSGSSVSPSRRRCGKGTSITASLRRGLELGRVDYVHAAGSLATLVILFFLMRIGLALLLESQADNTVRTAIFLSDAVLAAALPRRRDPLRRPEGSVRFAARPRKE